MPEWRLQGCSRQTVRRYTSGRGYSASPQPRESIRWPPWSILPEVTAVRPLAARPVVRHQVEVYPLVGQRRWQFQRNTSFIAGAWCRIDTGNLLDGMIGT